MDALIHVFPGLFHSCGVYSQVFSIATPAYFLAKLTLPLGKLSILCGFTPFFGYKGELHTSTGDIPIFHGETRSFWVSLHIIAPAVGPPGSPMGKTPPGEKIDQKLTGKIMGKRAE